MKKYRWGMLVAAALASSSFAANAQEAKLTALKADAKAKPTDFDAAFALGRAYRRAGKWADAKTELGRAVMLAGVVKPDRAAKARYEMARVEIDQGVTNPYSPNPPVLQTCKEIKLGSAGEALMHVCNAEGWLTFGRVKIARDELALAEKADASLYELKVAYAEADLGDGKPDDAIAKLKTLTAATPARIEGWTWLGRAYLEANDRADAVTALKKGRALDADDTETAYLLACALPDGVDARDTARAVVAMRTNYAEAELRLGDLELATAGVDAAKSAYEAALKLGGAKLAKAHIGLALAHVAEEDAAAAKKEADEGVKLAPNDERARLALAEAQALGGDVDAAVETFKTAMGIAPKDPIPLVRAAEVLLAAKEPVKAEAYAQLATTELPNDARTWAVLGDAKVANAEKPSAKEAYKKALACAEGFAKEASSPLPKSEAWSGVAKDKLEKKLAAL